MKSYEALKAAMNDVGVKFVAGNMNLSSSLLYKWCQPSEGPDSAGAGNPLDRVARIYDLTNDTRPIAWLCRQAGGYFVANPELDESTDLPLINVTRSILKEFSELLEEVSVSIDNDGRITLDEAERIRQAWEQLKMLTESFVSACEEGTYR